MSNPVIDPKLGKNFQFPEKLDKYIRKEVKRLKELDTNSSQIKISKKTLKSFAGGKDVFIRSNQHATKTVSSDKVILTNHDIVTIDQNNNGKADKNDKTMLVMFSGTRGITSSAFLEVDFKRYNNSPAVCCRIDKALSDGPHSTYQLSELADSLIKNNGFVSFEDLKDIQYVGEKAIKVSNNGINKERERIEIKANSNVKFIFGKHLVVEATRDNIGNIRFKQVKGKVDTKNFQSVATPDWLKKD